jgi:hypothetical protein
VPTSAASLKTHRSDDGKLVLMCHDDDVTNELAFCDVYWFPLQATRAEGAHPEVAQPAVAAAAAPDGALLAG